MSRMMDRDIAELYGQTYRSISEWRRKSLVEGEDWMKPEYPGLPAYWTERGILKAEARWGRKVRVVINRILPNPKYAQVYEEGNRRVNGVMVIPKALKGYLGEGQAGMKKVLAYRTADPEVYEYAGLK